MIQKFRSTFLGWLVAGIPILLLCAGFSGTSGVLLGSYLAFSSDLPKIPDLKAYKPKTVSSFYAEDGSVIGLFYKEKRFPIPLDSVPPHVIHAFLAAEDARFFNHTGVDLFGVVRAFVKNFAQGNFAQGGSTITQQVTRNFLLSKEKKLSRKIREAILAFRLEKTLPKEKILELYLNEIYMGKGAYGIESAARTYFDKSTAELTIPEAALLAGLVANPSRFSPQKNLEAALKRREFVLGSMLKNGFISEAQYQTFIATVPVFSDPKTNPYERVPYFTESVRQYVIHKYGEQKLYNEGLQVWTTCDLKLQDVATESLYRGAQAWEKRQQRPTGLVKRLKAAELKEFLSTQPDSKLKLGDYVQAIIVTNHSVNAKKAKGKQDDKIQECTLALQGNRQFKMSLESNIRFRPNDLLEFRVADVQESQLVLEHNRMPGIQGAVVCIENRTGYIRSLVGGLDFERSNFNRALQAARQPGSAFKPIVFSAALEWGGYSPNTVVLDDPIAVLMSKNEEWIPANSDGTFHGPITVRQAIAQSRNIVAVKLLMDIGMDHTIQLARAMGITSPMGKNLAMALGASEVTPLDLTSAYTVFPNLGVKVRPVFVKKVIDRFGNVLEDNTLEPINPSLRMTQDQPEDLSQPEDNTDTAAHYTQDQRNRIVSRPILDHSKFVSLDSLTDPSPRVLSPQTAYLMLSMLHDVCVSGTGAAVNKLKRPDLVGKTGTTDDCSDAWFIGSSPIYTTGVWMGHDTKTSLGKSEHGATAALPVWADFMKEVHTGQAHMAYPVPSGIVFLETAAYSGLLKQTALLSASPDFSPDPQLKQISPVDMVYVPSTGSDPYYGTPMLVNAPNQPESVRVLNPTGDTLGYGYYSKDPRGRPVVYPMNPNQQYDQEIFNSYNQTYYDQWDGHRPGGMQFQGASSPNMSGYIQ